MQQQSVAVLDEESYKLLHKIIMGITVCDKKDSDKQLTLKLQFFFKVSITGKLGDFEN
jgi:hypothetical protein